MMSKTKMVNGFSKMAGRTGLLIKKHKPEILIGIGIVTGIGSTVLACKSMLKVEEVLDRTNENLEKIRDVSEDPDKYGAEYTKEDATKDKAIVYVQTGASLAKLFGPAIGLGIISYSCFIGAHKILSKRNIALMGIYKTLEESYKNYRKRVVEEYGQDKDRQFLHGIVREDVVEKYTDKDGKKKKRKVVEEKRSTDYSIYAKFFDESSPNWNKNPEYNLMFLKAQENYYNDLLKARGHVFLNEVYEALGIEHTQAGAVVGWVLSEDNGDNYIDFGLYELNSERARAFVNGYERSILLDFNVDGVIFDQI